MFIDIYGIIATYTKELPLFLIRVSIPRKMGLMLCYWPCLLNTLYASLFEAYTVVVVKRRGLSLVLVL